MNLQPSFAFPSGGRIHSSPAAQRRDSNSSINSLRDLSLRDHHGNKLDQEVDGMLAEELNKLSFVDMNDINEEMHGVKSLAVKETPQIIANALQAFKTQLNSLDPSKKKAYLYILAVRREEQEIAQQHHQIVDSALSEQPPIFAAYIDNDDFRLRFLRCCLFNIPKAVLRFANYLNFVQTYFGDKYLQYLIRQSDLNANETKLLRKGLVQILPFRDRTGRRIIASLGNGLDLESATSMKVYFYIFDCITRDSIESQRNGIVNILDGAYWKGRSFLDEFKKKIIDNIRLRSTTNYTSPMLAAFGAIPTRVVCTHVCWPDSFILRTLSNMYLVHSKVLRGGTGENNTALEINRHKFHDGEETEMRYAVKSYGIPIELMPLTGTNSIKLNYHNQWIKLRRNIETNQAKNQERQNRPHIPEYDCGFEVQGPQDIVNLVECPGIYDVVFRNGVQSMENPGNVRFRNIILSYWEKKTLGTTLHRNSSSDTMEAFDDIKKYDDTYDKGIRDRLVNDTHAAKGRFLEWDKGLGIWVEIKDRARINRKVSMLFYNCTKRRYDRIRVMASNKTRKIQSSSSSLSAAAYQFIDQTSNKVKYSKDNADGSCCLPTNIVSNESANSNNKNTSSHGNSPSSPFKTSKNTYDSI